MKKRKLKRRKKSNGELRAQSKNITMEQEYGDMRSKILKRCIHGASMAIICLIVYIFTAISFYSIFFPGTNANDIGADKVGIFILMTVIGSFMSFICSFIIYQFWFEKK